MTSIVIFALEGVLQTGGGLPIDAGCRLYRTVRNSLASQAGIITQAEENTARRFLDGQHMPAPAFINVTEPAWFPWVSTANAIRRSYPYEIDWIITPDPDIAMGLYYQGFRSMLWADPRYSRPEFRPDAPGHQASSWNKLAAGLKEDRELAGKDERISPQ